MKLELHRCDTCNKILHVPDRSLHELTLKHVSQDDPNYDAINWEICSVCRDKFLQWIQKLQKQKES